MAGAQPRPPAQAPKGYAIPGITYSERYYDDVGNKFKTCSPLLAFAVGLFPS
jgi:hypothetical protein